MATFEAFFDANVLYPSGLRNFLMHLALTDSFPRGTWPGWSDDAVHHPLSVVEKALQGNRTRQRDNLWRLTDRCAKSAAHAPASASLEIDVEGQARDG